MAAPPSFDPAWVARPGPPTAGRERSRPPISPDSVIGRLEWRPARLRRGWCVGLRRRWSLIADRRFGQTAARGFIGKLGGAFALAAEQGAEQSALVTELGRAHGFAVRMVLGGRSAAAALRLADIQFARSQGTRIVDFVEAAGLLLLAAFGLGIDRPIGSAGGICLRRGQIDLRRQDERRALAIIDGGATAQPDALHHVLEDLLVDSGLVIVGGARAGCSGDHQDGPEKAARGGLDQGPHCSHSDKPAPGHSRATARRCPISDSHKARDQGAFAARPGNSDSYNRPTTPATMAASAKLKTYQSRRQSAVAT